MYRFSARRYPSESARCLVMCLDLHMDFSCLLSSNMCFIMESKALLEDRSGMTSAVTSSVCTQYT